MWLHQALEACEAGATFRLLPMVTAALFRLTTNPRIFPKATPLDDAVAFIDALAEAPGLDMPSIGPEWPLLRQLCTDKSLTANQVPDAWIATCVNYFGEHLVTFDADFKGLLRPARLTVLPAS